MQMRDGKQTISYTCEHTQKVTITATCQATEGETLKKDREAERETYCSNKRLNGNRKRRMTEILWKKELCRVKHIGFCKCRYLHSLIGSCG